MDESFVNEVLPAVLPAIRKMPIFSINKDGISRAVVNFTRYPVPQPLTLCFQFQSTALNHRYVLALAKTVFQSDPNAAVVSIQYIDRNVRHGARGMENRWLITVNNEAARDRLLQSGVIIFNKKVMLNRVDDIIQAEYKEFAAYIKQQTKMYVNSKMSTLKNRKYSLPTIPLDEPDNKPTGGATAGGTNQKLPVLVEADPALENKASGTVNGVNGLKH